MPIYARAGVCHVWLVDPQARTLEAFRLEGAVWCLVGAWGEQERPRVEPFAEIEIELEALWLQ